MSDGPQADNQDIDTVRRQGGRPPSHISVGGMPPTSPSASSPASDASDASHAPGAAAVLAEAFGRTPALASRALEGMSPDDLTRRLDPDANTIAWLVWHTARMQDAQVTAAERALGRDAEPTWTADGFAERFGLDVDEDDVGYGMSSDEVAGVRAPADLLLAYHHAVNERTLQFVRSLADGDLDTVVDPGWDPPVTLLARLVSIEQDAVQHLGQAAFVRGVLQRT
jgi:hypothetical protein